MYENCASRAMACKSCCCYACVPMLILTVLCVRMEYGEGHTTTRYALNKAIVDLEQLSLCVEILCARALLLDHCDGSHHCFRLHRYTMLGDGLDGHLLFLFFCCCCFCRFLTSKVYLVTRQCDQRRWRNEERIYRTETKGNQVFVDRMFRTSIQTMVSAVVGASFQWWCQHGQA